MADNDGFVFFRLQFIVKVKCFDRTVCGFVQGVVCCVFLFGMALVGTRKPVRKESLLAVLPSFQLLSRSSFLPSSV